MSSIHLSACLVGILLGMLAYEAACADSQAAQFPYLSPPPSKTPLNAYLLDELAKHSNNPGLDSMSEIMQAIHAQQHPDKRTCKSRRLLVTQFAVTNFEGIGSMLKQVMLGLAEAAYSNRTLIWGLDMPLMFEAMRHEWRFTHNSTALHKYGLECDWYGGGGPYGCLFESLSSCSITDLTWKELLQLGQNGHADQGRIRIQESRRGPAAYIPPAGRFSETGFYRHRWAGALAAYVFRLKKPVLEKYRERLLSLDWGESTVGIHVRHGDISAMPKEYGNRRTYDFDKYFKAVSKLSRKPTTIFVASDDPDTEDIIADIRLRHKKLLGSDIPVITVPSTDRYRTAHGSHTMASDGTCHLGPCSLYYTDVMQYKTLPEHQTPVQERLMRVLWESTEDIFLLSMSDMLIGTISSHFSTLPALLVLARTAARSPSDLVFVDAAEVNSGLIQNSFLHGSLNRTSAIPKNMAHMRWHSHQKRFKEQFPFDEVDPRNLSAGFHMEDGLPLMPSHIFHKEVQRWTGSNDALPIWRGECPSPRTAGADDIQYVMALINDGADHSDPHPNQALRCWNLAKKLLQKYKRQQVSVDAQTGMATQSKFEWDHPQAAELWDVVVENIGFVHQQSLFPYSHKEAHVAKVVVHNFGEPQPHWRLRLP